MSEVAAARIAARLDRLPASRSVWALVFWISLGGLFEFYNLFLTGYIAPSLVRAGLFTDRSLGPFAVLKSIAVGGVGTFVFSTFAGLWAGALLLSPLIDRCGRRSVFLGAMLWYTVCSAIMAFQRTGEALNLWRFAAGVGFGLQLVTQDAFLAELMPFAERGRAFAVNQFVTFGVVPLAALLAWLLAPVHFAGLAGWRWVILLGTSGLAVAGLLHRFLPESPRWLALHGREAEAERIVAALERRVAAETGRPLPPPRPPTPEQAGPGRLSELLSPRYVERTLMLGIFNVAQVIGFYGFAAWVPTLLMARGITITASLEYSFIIASANPIGPLLATFFADRLERRTQIIGGLACMALFMTGFSLASSPLSLILLGVMFTLSANVMSYAYHAYQAELFPTRLRGRAIGFVYSWSRLTAAFAALIVGFFLHFGGVPAIAAFIGVAMAIGVIIVGVFGPDTRARPLEAVNF